jgi:hypothetical protein
MISFVDLAAKKKLNTQDDTLKVVSMRAVVGGILVEVCKTTKYLRGIRKGQHKYDLKTKASVLLTSQDIQEQETAYELETGNCHLCQGMGRTWVGWSKENGSKFETCSRCNGETKYVGITN